MLPAWVSWAPRRCLASSSTPNHRANPRSLYPVLELVKHHPEVSLSIPLLLFFFEEYIYIYVIHIHIYIYPYKYTVLLLNLLCLQSHCNVLYDLLLPLKIMFSRRIHKDTVTIFSPPLFQLCNCSFCKIAQFGYPFYS